MGASLVEHLAGVQAHGALSEVGEFMLDLVALHHALLGYDFLEQHAELRNVPLAIAQRVKRPALGVVGLDPEGRIKGAARGDHAQLLVEHKNGLADGVDNALSERPRVCDVRELRSEVGRLHATSAIYLVPDLEKDSGPGAGIARIRALRTNPTTMPKAGLYQTDHFSHRTGRPRERFPLGQLALI